MAKCKRCSRELKNHTESGMGKVCQMKANRETSADETGVRVEPLFVRRPARRSYLVFTKPRFIVTVEEDSDGRFANCPCSIQMCEHRRLVAEIDRAKFPVDLFVSDSSEKEEFHYQAGEIELYYENTGYWESA